MTPSLLAVLGIKRLITDNVIRVNFPRRGKFLDARRLFRSAEAIDENPDRYDEALFLYNEAVRLDPSFADAYVHMGCVLFRQGRIGTAEIAWRKANDIDPSQPFAHYNLGYCAMLDKEYGVAAGHLRRAVTSDPDFADAHYNLGLALSHCFDSQKAKTHFKRYLELEPSGEWSDEARKHV